MKTVLYDQELQGLERLQQNFVIGERDHGICGDNPQPAHAFRHRRLNDVRVCEPA